MFDSIQTNPVNVKQDTKGHLKNGRIVSLYVHSEKSI